MSNTNHTGPAAAFGDFGKWVPGFDFLKGLSQPAAGAGAAVPPLAGWVAPTLSVEDLDKRIQELRAVLFWLEQNATALKATIQAMEVQKMTLATLRGMNVSLQEMAQAFSAPVAQAAAAAQPAPGASAGTSFAGLEVPPPSAARKAARNRKAAAPAAPEAAADKPASPSLVDPMQWWGALTQQFQGIASTALKEAQARGLDPVAAEAAGQALQAGQAWAEAAREAGTPRRKPASRAASAARGKASQATPAPAPAKKGRARTASKPAAGRSR